MEPSRREREGRESRERFQDDGPVLVCLRYGIGDLVMELPALDALRDATSHVPLAVLGSRPAIQLLEGDRRIGELHAQQDFGFEHRWDAGDAAGAALGAWLDQRRFGLVLDAVHAPPAVAREVESRGIHRADSDPHAEAQALRAGRAGVEAIAAGVEAGWAIGVPRPARPRLRLGAEREWADRFLGRMRVDRPAIGVMPSASADLKRWPVERFAAIGKQLLEETAAPLLLFDAPRDSTTGALRARLPRGDRLVRVPVLHLRRTAAVLERCRLFISNDTGLMHVAAAVGTPVVSVFGATHPVVYLPPGESHRAVDGERPCPHRSRGQIGPPDCWMHGRCLEGERACIRSVGLVAVREAVREALDADAYSRGPAETNDGEAADGLPAAARARGRRSERAR